MRILWLCSTPVRAVTESLGLPTAVLGGWMNGAYNDLMAERDIKLCICYPQSRVDFPEQSVGEGFTSFGFPWKGEEDSNANPTRILFKRILEDFCPDCIHIFGTEHEYCLLMAQIAEACGLGSRISISIQGLVSIYGLQFLPDFPRKELKRASLSELKNRCSLWDQRESYLRRGESEKRLIEKAHYVMGRTEWDEGCCRLINPYMHYRYVGETLRDEFYHAEPRCEIASHRIFFSQGGKPIKAMHRLVEALPIVKSIYPDVKVVVSGISSLRTDRLRGLTYDRYLARRMNELGVADCFEFLGMLGPSELIAQMQSCALFVSTSSIENSPNSMGEAMMLGLPCVASYVGGVPSIAKPGEEALLFPLNETEMLAHYIIWVFSHEREAEDLGLRGRTRALINHSRERNREQLISVYREISAGADGAIL